MNSKTLVLSVFVVWSVLCWYRYVCGIKQQCGDQPQQMHQATSFDQEMLNRKLPDPQTSDSPGQPAFTPIEDDVPETPANTPAQPSPSRPDPGQVRVEELSDHVRIHFPYNSTRKQEDEAIDAYLSRLAQQLVSSGGSVTLTGHTDNVGDSKSNYAIGLRRAKNIRDILIKKGVAKTQITCKSAGESKNLAGNDTPQDRYLNRRVEIRVNQ